MGELIGAKSLGIGEREVEVINYLNIVLMIASLIVASYVPLETFIFAYAFLGPLHYLTEISWLHDRKYFSFEARELLWLCVPASLIIVASGLGRSPWSFQFSVVLMATMLLASAGLGLTASKKKRLIIALVGLLMGVLALWNRELSIFLAVFVPTLVHVYLFTGLFIIYGALKGRSASGILSACVFAVCPLLCLYGLRTPEAYQVDRQFLAASGPFQVVGHYLMPLMGLENSRESFLAFMRLMAFAYTYHYLNWFSKTRIINWHQTSPRRLTIIGVLYAASVTIYSIDFHTGFVVLLFLSTLHVVLEFPLNYRSAAGIGQEVMRRLR